MLIAQGGPQNAGGPASGGHPSDQVRFREFELGVVAEQNGLMQDESIDRIEQGSAQMNIAGFDNLVAFTLLLTNAGVVTATN